MGTQRPFQKKKKKKKLLNSIKILMHEPKLSNYTFAPMTEYFKRVVNMKKKYNEILLDYSKILKQAKYIMEVHIGKDILGHYV